jgi:hypothetical protein
VRPPRFPLYSRVGARAAASGVAGFSLDQIFDLMLSPCAAKSCRKHLEDMTGVEPIVSPGVGSGALPISVESWGYGEGSCNLGLDKMEDL